MSDNITAAAARALPCIDTPRKTCAHQPRDPMAGIPCGPCEWRPAVEAEMRKVVAEVVREMVEVANDFPFVYDAKTYRERTAQIEAMRQRARKWGVE